MGLWSTTVVGAVEPAGSRRTMDRSRGAVEGATPSLISHGRGSLFMQKPLRLIALSIFAVVVSLHAARADQCDDTIAAWNKRASRHSDEGLDRLAVSPNKKRTRAEEIA